MKTTNIYATEGCVDAEQRINIIGMRPPSDKIWINPGQWSIPDTLVERKKTYGDFDKLASISQRLKAPMRACPSWQGLDNDMKESLEMIQHKIARILNGDPNYQDSWADIAGYAQLVANRLCTKN